MSSLLPRAQWRLLRHAPASGTRNMAVDDAILELARKGAAPPTLRLYDWAPGTLTLGLGQPLADVDQARLAAHGWGMVRRPTGGRAILHIDELTYSVIGANDDFYDPQGSYGQPPGGFVQQPGPYGQQQPGGWVQQGPYAQQPPGLYGRQPQGPRPPGALQPLTDATGRPVLDRWGRPVMVSPEAQRAVRSGTGGLY